ncbi:MAG TPA: cytochrome c3 family protein [Caldilineaceae bacterium]|nr:cytochrome c3 family protein [Caldilineaceae bacterium]
MAQIFHPSANSFARVSIFGAVFFIAALAGIGLVVARSDYSTNVGVVQPQPVQFSHAHHVDGLGIDCRYCHTSVEESSFAGMPSTHTCMTCHSQIWNNSPILEPVRESYRTGVPLAWTRVHDLGDFVYFNHSIHVQKGIGCTDCHGQVDEMNLMWKAEPMTMEWCLDCHRQPERYLRPVDEVFNMDYRRPADQLALGRQLIEEYQIPVERLTDCYVCHR